jgi:hypothetical protein
MKRVYKIEKDISRAIGVREGVQEGENRVWSMSRNSDFIASVIPAQAGIQSFHGFLDAPGSKSGAGGSSPA